MHVKVFHGKAQSLAILVSQVVLLMENCEEKKQYTSLACFQVARTRRRILWISYEHKVIL